MTGAWCLTPRAVRETEPRATCSQSHDASHALSRRCPALSPPVLAQVPKALLAPALRTGSQDWHMGVVTL